MLKRAIFVACAAILVGCGGGDDGDEVSAMVEQHKIMLVNACMAEDVVETRCNCAATILEERLEPALFLSAANAIAKGDSPSKWLATVSDDQKEAAQSAVDLVKDCR